jgi:hypothetical protein
MTQSVYPWQTKRKTYKSQGIPEDAGRPIRTREPSLLLVRGLLALISSPRCRVPAFTIIIDMFWHEARAVFGIDASIDGRRAIMAAHRTDDGILGRDSTSSSSGQAE